MSIRYPDLLHTHFPNDLENFVTMLNMTAADAPSIKLFQQAMDEGDLNSAQIYYNEITNANQKFVDATKLNTLMDTCVALQRFYSQDLKPYIEEKQGQWEDNINRFIYKGVYDPTVSYVANNFVLFDTDGINLIYICTTPPPNPGISPLNTLYWRPLTIQGVKGQSGTDGISFLFDWNSETQYVVNDVVTYGYSIWIATQDNHNTPPASGSAYWALVAKYYQQPIHFQSTEPTFTPNTGELWFQILGAEISG